MTFKDKFKGYRDWFGTQIPGSKHGKFRNFEDARTIILKLKLRGHPGWTEFCKSGKRPENIPRHPEKTYKDEWRGWVDWTGIDAVKQKFKKLRPFKEAREYVRKLGLKNTYEWDGWKKSGKKPNDIPATPALVYKEEWGHVVMFCECPDARLYRPSNLRFGNI